MRNTVAVDPKAYLTLDRTLEILSSGIGSKEDPPIQNFCSRVCEYSGTSRCPFYGQKEPPKGCRTYSIRASSEEEAEKVIFGIIETERQAQFECVN
jgi:hypothetical protein